MDRSVTELSPQEWARLLLSRSPRIEGSSRLSSEQWHSAMEMLGTLESLTSASLIPPAAPTSAQTAVDRLKAALSVRARSKEAQSSYQIPAPAAPKAPAQVTTSKPEYREALQDRRVLEALMEYHRRAATLQKEAPALSMSSFAPVTVPEVEAKPKPSAAFRRNFGVSLPVLRMPQEP